MQRYITLSVLGILALGQMHAEDLDKAKTEVAVMIAPQHPPTPQMEQVPRSPGPGYFWIKGNWQWNNNQWQWVAGHWERQPRPGSVWVNGEWRQTRGGWLWIPGQWR